jgi:hypothetical protein
MVASTIKTACERPHSVGRSPSPWDGLELARQLGRKGVIESIPLVTVYRILVRHQLKPGTVPLAVVASTEKYRVLCTGR